MGDKNVFFDVLVMHAVGELRGPLELEVAEAVSVCWVEEKGRTIQVLCKAVAISDVMFTTSISL